MDVFEKILSEIDKGIKTIKPAVNVQIGVSKNGCKDMAKNIN